MTTNRERIEAEIERVRAMSEQELEEHLLLIAAEGYAMSEDRAQAAADRRAARKANRN